MVLQISLSLLTLENTPVSLFVHSWISVRKLSFDGLKGTEDLCHLANWHIGLIIWGIPSPTLVT